MLRSPGPKTFRRTLAAALSATLLVSCARFQRLQEAPLPPVDVSAVEPRPVDNDLPEHWHRGAFMQIDVRTYQDSDGDGVGDLRGLIRRLDALKDLGIRGLSLMSLLPGGEREGGSGATDHRAIDPACGTLADFDELLRQAHARGLGVIMDYAANHSAADHAIFVQSRSSPSNPYRDWYLWSEAPPRGWNIGGRNPWYHAAVRPWTWTGRWEALPRPDDSARGHYFGSFGGDLPDFNLRHPKVVAWHLDNLRFWLNRGLDGFTLGAVSNLIENDATRWSNQPESLRLASLLAETIRSYPQRYVVCEASSEPQRYADPAVCGGAFAIDPAALLVKAAQGDAGAVKELSEQGRRASPALATVLTSAGDADETRLWDQLKGDVAGYKLVAAGYLLQPGTPFIVYGEEVGQAGPKREQATSNEGPRPRAPMSWTADNVGDAGFTPKGPPSRAFAPNVAEQNLAAQRDVFGSIHSAYKDLLDLRNRRPSVSRGSLEQSFARGMVTATLRVSGDERTLVVTNYGTRRVEVEVTGLPRRARVAPLYPRRAGASYIAQIVLADARGELDIDMPPRTTRVFDVEPQRRN